MDNKPEQNESLWLLTASPSIWAGHFLFSYITVAIYCEKFAVSGESLGTARIAISVCTVVALLAIILFGWIGLKRHRFGNEEIPHDDDTPHDRHRFIGFATLLLSALSFVATVFVALTLVFIGDCT
jgi:hypothetical protein